MAGAITRSQVISAISMTHHRSDDRSGCNNSFSETQIELAYLGGAAGRVDARETAFGDRSAPFIMNLLANWADPAADADNISWVRGLFNKLRPAMKPGVYVNFMSGDEQDRVPEAYQERWERMLAVKSHYDPANFFRMNQNVVPRTPAPKPK